MFTGSSKANMNTPRFISKELKDVSIGCISSLAKSLACTASSVPTAMTGFPLVSLTKPVVKEM